MDRTSTWHKVLSVFLAIVLATTLTPSVAWATEPDNSDSGNQTTEQESTTGSDADGAGNTDGTGGSTSTNSGSTTENNSAATDGASQDATNGETSGTSNTSNSEALATQAGKSETTSTRTTSQTEDSVVGVGFGRTYYYFADFDEAFTYAMSLTGSSSDNRVRIRLCQNVTTTNSYTFDQGGYYSFNPGAYMLTTTSSDPLFSVYTNNDLNIYGANATGGLSASRLIATYGGTVTFEGGSYHYSGVYTGEIYVSPSGGTVNIYADSYWYSSQFYTTLYDAAATSADDDPNINITCGSFYGIDGGTVVAKYGQADTATGVVTTYVSHFVEDGYYAIRQSNGEYRVGTQYGAVAVVYDSEGEVAALSTTLKGAFNSASDGCTIKILADVELAEDWLRVEAPCLTAKCGGTVTVDMMGHTITGTWTSLMYSQEGTSLIIEDSTNSGESALINTGSWGFALYNDDFSSITVASDITLSGTAGAVKSTSGTITVNSPITATSATPVFDLENTTLVVNSQVTRTVESDQAFIYARSGSAVTLASGSVTDTASTLVVTGTSAISVAEGFTFNNSLSIEAGSLSASNVTFPYGVSATLTDAATLDGATFAGAFTLSAGTASVNGSTFTDATNITTSGETFAVTDSSFESTAELTASTGSLSLNNCEFATTVNLKAENGTLTIESSTFGDSLTVAAATTNIAGGTFNAAVTVNATDATISGGNFASTVTYNTGTDAGTFAIAGGTFASTVSYEGAATLAISGGEFADAVTGTATNALTVSGGTFAKETTFTTGTSTISGGTFNANLTLKNSGAGTISGGTFAEHVEFGGSGTTEISGGDFNTLEVMSVTGTVTVTNGTFTSGLGGYGQNGYTLQIKGGIWKTQPESNAIANGYAVQLLLDGTYAVYAMSNVAVVNGAGYDSLQDAVNAAGSGDTVFLVQDIYYLRQTVVIAADDNITLNLGNHTLSAYASDSAFTPSDASNPAILYNLGTLTVTNGTVQSNIGSAGFYDMFPLAPLVNAGTATVQDSTLQAVFATGDNMPSAVVALSGSETVLTNSTVLAEVEDIYNIRSSTNNQSAIMAYDRSQVTATGLTMTVVDGYSFVGLEGSANVSLVGGTYTQVNGYMFPETCVAPLFTGKLASGSSTCPTLSISGGTYTTNRQTGVIDGCWNNGSSKSSCFQVSITNNATFEKNVYLQNGVTLNVDGATFNGDVGGSTPSKNTTTSSYATVRNATVMGSFFFDYLGIDAVVYSGLFGDSRVQFYMPTGYVLTSEYVYGQTMYRVSTGGNVAIDSNGTSYSSLTEALNHGGTITVITDATLTEAAGMNAGVTTTLNLDGWNLYYEGSGEAFTTNAGNLTITGDGGITNTGSGAAVENSGTLTIAGGSYGAESGAAVYQAAGTTTVSGGTYAATDALFNVAGGTLTSASATIAGETCPMFLASESGTVNISGGSYSVTGAPVVKAQGSGTVSVSGGSFTASDASPIAADGSGAVAVSGGTFTTGSDTIISTAGDSTVAVDGGAFTTATGTFAQAAGNSAIVINGGTFTRTDETTNVCFATLDSGTITINDGTFSVQGGIEASGTGLIIYQGTFSSSVEPYVSTYTSYITVTDDAYKVTRAAARIGDTFYDSLQTALNRANGKTVELVNNISARNGQSFTLANGTVTLDLSDYVISGNVDGALLIAYGNLTLTASGEGSIVNASTDASACAVEVGTVSSNKGALTLGTVALDSDVCAICVSSASNTVTMDKNSKVVLGGTGSFISNNGTVTITGGTISRPESSTALFTQGDGATYAITGGTFPASVSNVLSTDYVETLNSDGTYSVSIIQSISGSTVSLDSGEIVSNAYLELNDTVTAKMDSAYVVASTNSGSVSAPLSSLEREVDGQVQYVLSVGVAAKEMADDIAITLYLADGINADGTLINPVRVSSATTYSVANYANAVIDNAGEQNYSAEMVTLAKALANYGAYAQTYFIYNTGDLANAGLGAGETELTASAIGLTDEYVDQLFANAAEASESDTGTGITYAGNTLLLESNTTLRYYFTGDVTGATWTLDDKAVTPQWSSANQMWYVDVADIAATDIATPHELVITTAAGAQKTVSVSALNYIETAIANASTNQALANVASALKLYSAAGQAYLATKATVEG